MKKSQIIVTLCSFLLVFNSCLNQKHEPFDSEKWKQVSGESLLSDVREVMVSDLIKSDTLLGLDSLALTNLLGVPYNKKENVLNFYVREKYTTNIDPDYICYLKVSLDSNNLVSKCEMIK